MSEDQETANLYFNTDREYSIGDLQLDLILSEEESLSGRATTAPVEDGADLSDSVEIDPPVLKLTGFITNTPVKDVEGNLSTRYQDAIRTIKEIRKAKLPVTIVSMMEVYENMVIEELSIPRNAGIGEAVEFSMSLRQIEVKKSQTAVIPVSILDDKQAQGDVDMGQTNDTANDVLGDEEAQKTWYERMKENLETKRDDLDERISDYG
jgi:hypothetical protein